MLTRPLGHADKSLGRSVSSQSWDEEKPTDLAAMEKKRRKVKYKPNEET